MTGLTICSASASALPSWVFAVAAVLFALVSGTAFFCAVVLSQRAEESEAGRAEDEPGEKYREEPTTDRTEQTDQEVARWQPVRFFTGSWTFVLPNGRWLVGFESEAAARSAVARLRPMWAALVAAPEHLFVPFRTDGEGWGFFDREGKLHADFSTQFVAAGFAARMQRRAGPAPATAPWAIQPTREVRA